MPRNRAIDQPFTFMTHFQGGIVEDGHDIGFRTYVKTLNHLSNAIDRATITEHRQELHKRDSISRTELDLVPLIIQDPENGGYISKLYDKTNSPFVKRVMDRIANAIDVILRNDDARRMTRTEMRQTIEHYENDPHLNDIALQNRMLGKEPILVDYSMRVIGREINIALTGVRDETRERSNINLAMQGVNGTRRFNFDRETAQKFSDVVGSKYISFYKVYTLQFLSVDFSEQNLVAKARDEETNMIRKVIFRHRPSMRAIRAEVDENYIQVVACPVIEGGAADSLKGDLYYIKKYND